MKPAQPGRLFCLFVLAAAWTRAADEVKLPILLDTDIGNSADDVFALGYAAVHPRIDLVAVTTCGRGAEDRAWIVCRFLTALDKQSVPVAWGRDPQPGDDVNWQIQYRRHPAAVWNRTSKPSPKPAEELLRDELAKRPGELTIVALGPLTNVARLLSRYPETKPWIRRIVFLGGALRVGYNGKAPVEPEWNVKTDVEAARSVFAAGIPLEIAPLDAAVNLVLPPARLQELLGAHNAVTHEVQALFELIDEPQPTLFDAAAIALALDASPSGRFKTERLRLEVEANGVTRAVPGEPNATVATQVESESLLDGMVKTLTASGVSRLPQPAWNIQRSVERLGLPARVHVVEDYETDIEKRWWLTGKLESEESPAGKRRVCRAVITQDYDDLQGDARARYKAVVFNPVPGPPMGPRTRLSFRYKLRGTDTLRVQIYSLSNGYHRALTLKGLPQDRWEELTVDMTQSRRPDGSGGPLASDERIDDVQFYVDPRADLWIDWLLLYDEASRDEQLAFPTTVSFTGWFDTGAQGKEWPGDFEIVKHDAPRTWKAAKCVIAKETGRPWIRVHLRGERPVAAATRLRFSCKSDGSRALTVELVHARTGARVSRDLTGVAVFTPGAWTEVDVELPGAPAVVDEIRFLAADEAAFWVDDVLLYQLR